MTWILLGVLPMHLGAEPLIQSRYAESIPVAFTIGTLALGVLLGLLAYTLFLAISTGERMFVYFSLIMVLLTVLQTFATYDRFFFRLTYNRVTLITHLLFITFLLFFEDFFSLQTHARSLARFNRLSLVFIASYTVLFLVLKLSFPQADTLASVLNFIRELLVFYTNFLFLTTIIWAIRWMRTEALLILAAFIPPAVLTSINALSMFSFMARHASFVTFLMTYNQPIGLSLQAILFSLAIANRYNRIKLARQEAEQERLRLEKLDAEKTEFFMNMSHELRTPLTIILGMIGLLRRGSYGDSVHANDRILHMVERNALRLLRQVNHLLRLGKEDEHEQIRSVQIVQTIRSIVEEFRPIATERTITLTETYDDHVLPIALNLYADDVETAVMNLISNALKFTPSGGTITIDVRVDSQQRLQISVSDTGVGIDAQDFNQIFTRFFTINDQSPYAQTGLGLPLVKTIMDRYGGSVEVQSTPGEGSIFTLTFPESLLVSTDTASHAETPELEALSRLYTSEFSDQEHVETLAENDQAPRVLVIDDNYDMCSYITSLLRKTCSVHCAFSGEEGLDFLTTHTVDLVICDIMMPDMDGHAVLEQLRLQAHPLPIPLVFLTARDSMQEQVASLHEGAVRYITKPFTAEMLIATVEAIISHDREVAESQVSRLRQKIDEVFDDLSRQTSHPLHAQMHTFAEANGLTSREREIVTLIVEGKSDKEIAFSLGLSPRTIENHNQRLYRKAGVSGRYELISHIYQS